MHHDIQPDPAMPTESFPTSPAGLPEATRPELLELAPGDTLELRVGPVAKRLGDTTVRMLGYNGSIPGPTLKVRQGSEIIVHVTNHGDLDTTVHWHGLRLENKYDGVPHETQAPIPVGGEFTYRIQFPDAGLYWYHPHIREDYTQELGLYGNIVVVPTDPDYWPPADRDLILTVDDLLVEDGKIAPFSPTETSYAAMGRFGNVFLVSGQPDLHLEARAGEAVRLWLTNTANTRVFNLTIPGARMKLVGGDSGRVEDEEFIESVVLAPSERAVVDVLVEQPGKLALEHHTPDRVYRLATVTVAEGRRRRRRRRGSSSGYAGPLSWRPNAGSWTAGWPPSRTRCWPWSPRWTTRRPCQQARGRWSTPARCTPKSPARNPGAVPSAA
jgi:FtsP/CotA-like multicopper oxidase with cupredoxin domain